MKKSSTSVGFLQVMLLAVAMMVIQQKAAAQIDYAAIPCTDPYVQISLHKRVPLT